MLEGSVVSIHIAADRGAPTTPVPEAQAVPAQGLTGDRHFGRASHDPERPRPDRELTLIEIETIEALRRDNKLQIEPGDARRNVVTRGVALNHLIGREFTVGEVALRGVRLCEPCGHLADLTSEDVKQGLVHRGGLRAQILTEGVICPGDTIRER
jgi:MOSC domain-containing protein YiiM